MAEETAEERQVKGIAGGLGKILSGVLEIKKNLSRRAFLGLVATGILAGGGIGDRSMGFPILRYMIRPIVAEQEKRDSVLKAEIKEQIGTVAGKVDTLIARESETRDVVDRIAKYTGTAHRIRRDRDRARDPGVFGWSLPTIQGAQ